MDVKPIQRPGSLKDLAYQEIKKQLLAGGFRRDAVYSANQFAEILAVSRTPAREAVPPLGDGPDAEDGPRASGRAAGAAKARGAPDA